VSREDSVAEPVPAPAGGETESLEAFRERVGAWLGEHAPRRSSQGWAGAQHAATREQERGQVAAAKRFQARLFEAGLVGLRWPRAYGGRGLSLAHEVAFAEAVTPFDLPTGFVFSITFGMCGPTLLAHGTELQKRRHIAPMLRGAEIWCQLFSEPDAGSDLAAIRSSAVRDADHWVVTGQKVWSSGAHYSDFGLLLARTAPELPKHRGLTMFIVDMRWPGLTVRPLRQMNGAEHFNEVFLDSVRIPVGNVVGEVNDGWRTAITTLMNERVALGGGGDPDENARVESLFRLARDNGYYQDPVIRDRLANVYIQHTIIGLIGQRVRDAALRGVAPGPEGSIAKLVTARYAKGLAALAADIAGAQLGAWDGADPRGAVWANLLLSAPARSIAGGTDEVQKNIIGDRVLGLPRDPEPGRDAPFQDQSAAR
jgi:alkylation response protein AidB-like acyl-CoA dehydrogenase